MFYPDCSLFALIDGLQYERYFGDEIQHEQGVAEPFLNSWPDSRLAFAGPWLFRLNNSVSHREKLKQLAEAIAGIIPVFCRVGQAGGASACGHKT